MNKHKYSIPMMILAVITLILSSYGLYALAHDYGNIPSALALLVVAGFDLFAVAAGNHAITIARDGDSPGVWNFAVVGAAILSAVLQFTHTQLDGQPWAVGVMMAMFPIATVMLFEGTLRRAARLNGRRTGRVAEPRASFEILQWFVYPRATWHAFKFGVADRTLGGDAAFKLGLVTTKPEETNYVPPQRVEVEWNYAQSIPGYSRVVAGQHVRELPGSSGGTGPDASGDARPEVPRARPVAEIVREKLQVHGVDESARAAIIAEVREERPDASEDTIRRTIRKESALRSA